VNTVDAACQQVKKTNASANEMSSKHIVEMDALIRLVALCAFIPTTLCFLHLSLADVPFWLQNCH